MSQRLFALLFVASLAWAQEAEEAKETKEPERAEKKQKARIAEVEIKIDGVEDPHPAVPFLPQKLNYRGFLKLVDRIAEDPECDAVLLKPKSYGVGWARLLEVREALLKLKRAGKRVFVYKESYQAPDLVLASVADRVSMPESGMVALPGLAIESWYMREMLAKLRIKFDVIHIGEYKSAGESLVRDSMSKQLEDSLNPILDELYGSMVKAIAEGRGLTADAVRNAVDRGLLTPQQAKEAGLVDRIEYEDQFRAGIKAFFPDRKLLKWKDPEKKKGMQIDPNNPMAVFTMFFSMLADKKERLPEGPKVAIVYCTGPITSGKSQYDWFGNVASMGSETIVKAIDKARENDDVKAIVLRVNSPGGSGLASDMIWRAVERARELKPVVASMGDVAASGGYWISMNSTKIVAEPQTITGSIGVVGIVPNVDDLYPWIGINPERLTRGKRAAALLTTKGFGENDKEMLRSFMREFYDDFVAKVAAGRGKTPAEIEPIARGRVWTGRKALDLGLVDQLGGLEDATALARQLGGIAGDDFHVLELPRRAGPFEMLQEMFEAREGLAALGMDAALLKRAPLLRRVLVHLQTLRAVARDKVCVIHPELTGLLRPFATDGR